MEPSTPAEPEPDLEQLPSSPSSDDFMPPLKPRHVVLALLKWLAVAIIVAAIVVGAIWLIKHHKAAPAYKTSTTQTQTRSQQTPLVSASTTHYDSSNLNLGLDYPSDWTVSDTLNKLTVTSPPLQLKFAGGQTSTGQIVLSIQPQQTSVAQFAKGTAVAVLESQKITYKSPTPDQRAQTYVTFVSYSGDSTSLDALYITGDNGYQAGQSIPQSDIVQDNPLVSISFSKCADATCKTAGTPTPLAVSAWSNNELSQPLLKLLESLVLN